MKLPCVLVTRETLEVLRETIAAQERELDLLREMNESSFREWLKENRMLNTRLGVLDNENQLLRAYRDGVEASLKAKG